MARRHFEWAITASLCFGSGFLLSDHLHYPGAGGGLRVDPTQGGTSADQHTHAAAGVDTSTAREHGGPPIHRTPALECVATASEGSVDMLAPEPAEYARFLDETRTRLEEIRTLRVEVLARDLLAELGLGEESLASFVEVAKTLVRGMGPVSDDHVLDSYARAAALDDDPNAALPAGFVERLLRAYGASEETMVRVSSRQRQERQASWVRRISGEVQSVATLSQKQRVGLEAALGTFAAQHWAEVTVAGTSTPSSALRLEVLRHLDRHSVIPHVTVALLERLWFVNGLLEES